MEMGGWKEEEILNKQIKNHKRKKKVWNDLEQSKQFKVWTLIVKIKSCFAIVLLPI